MVRSVTATALAILALAIGGCAWLKDEEESRRDWTAEQFYRAAKEQFDNRSWDAAIRLYEQLESKYPFGRHAQQAQLETAYAYYKQGEPIQALSAVDRFIKTHPNHRNIDYALYLKGLVNFKDDQGMLSRIMSQDLAERDPKAAREAFEVFKELVTRFPESRYAPDARDRMAFLIEALARGEINVARYYLRRQAWLAAANRAQGAIARYPHSPIQKEALEIMIEAYDRMGMDDLRDDARKVLAKNFPEDRMAQSGQNRAKPWWKFW